LQPANSAKDNAVVAVATMLNLNESIASFVTQPPARDKSAETPAVS